MPQALAQLQATERGIGLRLLVWAGLSVVSGIVLLGGLAGSMAMGIGVQAVAWGVIDALIAAVGLRGSSRGTNDAETRRARLVRLLAVNTVLDILYIAAGIVIWVSFAENPFISGNGVGVVIQGAFLFIFDLYHTIAVAHEPKR